MNEHSSPLVGSALDPDLCERLAAISATIPGDAGDSSLIESGAYLWPEGGPNDFAVLRIVG